MILKPNKYSATYNNNTLYTKGGEYTLLSTGNEYKGQYHLIQGIPYAGKPKDPGTPQRLISIEYVNNDLYIYDKAYNFKNQTKSTATPKFFRPTPTATEYEIGYLYRYIVSHNLDVARFPIEIGISQANTYGGRQGIDAGLWTLHKIKWVIVGSLTDYQLTDPTTKGPGPVIYSIENQNTQTLTPIIRKYPSMQFAFRNYTEFAQPAII